MFLYFSCYSLGQKNVQRIRHKQQCWYTNLLNSLYAERRNNFPLTYRNEITSVSPLHFSYFFSNIINKNFVTLSRSLACAQAQCTRPFRSHSAFLLRKTQSPFFLSLPLSVSHSPWCISCICDTCPQTARWPTVSLTVLLHRFFFCDRRETSDGELF